MFTAINSKIRASIVAVALLLTAGSAFVVPSSAAPLDNDRRFSSRHSYAAGYREGYRDGYRDGREDARRHRRFDGRVRSFRRGPDSAFLRGFENGFERGYRVGWFSVRRDRHDRDDWRDRRHHD
jgi:hypothetical protein